VNEFNIKLRGKSHLIVDIMWSHIKLFEVKIKLLPSHIEKKINFPACKNVFESSKFTFSLIKFVNLFQYINPNLINTFKILKTQYFQ